MNEVDAFLSHHGVKGQKWGIRNRLAQGKAPSGDFKSRSKRQKAALVGGGVVGWVIAGKVTNKILGTKMPLAQIGLGAASTVAGVRATRHLLDKHKNVSVSSLPG